VSGAGTTLVVGGDLEVGRFGFGAMRITGPGIWGEPADPAGARALLRHVVDAGVNLIDTADSYGPDVSENLIAEALYPYPDGLVIATKGGMTRSGPSRWGTNCRPERLKRCCEDSLRRLRLERIDLYQLHAVDPQVPVEDSVGALVELQEEGKIRHIGVSNVSGEELDRARQIATVVSVQNRYNLADRASEDVLQACEQQGLAFLPWAPLSAGRLTEPGVAVDQIARDHQASAAQVAIAWLLRHSPSCSPRPSWS
jgi:aryl-alcohol dehydrogenase-like predicted oxidoreductase